MPNTGYGVAVTPWVASESQKVIGSNFYDWRNCSGSPVWEAPIRQNLAVLSRFHSLQKEDSQPVFCLLNVLKSFLHNFSEEA